MAKVIKLKGNHGFTDRPFEVGQDHPYTKAVQRYLDGDFSHHYKGRVYWNIAGCESYPPYNLHCLYKGQSEFTPLYGDKR